jgi:hypothetical protein
MSKVVVVLQRASSVLFALATGTAATSAAAEERIPPKTIPFESGDRLPEGYRIERTWRSFWLIPGATAFGLSYFMAFGGAAASDFRGPYSSLAIPVAGPFIALFWRPTRCEAKGVESEFSCALSFEDGDEGMTIALLVDGFAQVVSGTLVAFTLGAPRYVFERGSIRVAPARVGSGSGLSVRGTF